MQFICYFTARRMPVISHSRSEYNIYEDSFGARLGATSPLAQYPSLKMPPIIMSPLPHYSALAGYANPAFLHPDFSTQSLDRRK